MDREMERERERGIVRRKERGRDGWRGGGIEKEVTSISLDRER